MTCMICVMYLCFFVFYVPSLFSMVRSKVYAAGFYKDLPNERLDDGSERQHSEEHRRRDFAILSRIILLIPIFGVAARLGQMPHRCVQIGGGAVYSLPAGSSGPAPDVDLGP
jgi:hypothetical protein